MANVVDALTSSSIREAHLAAEITVRSRKKRPPYVKKDALGV